MWEGRWNWKNPLERGRWIRERKRRKGTYIGDIFLKILNLIFVKKLRQRNWPKDGWVTHLAKKK